MHPFLTKSVSLTKRYGTTAVNALFMLLALVIVIYFIVGPAEGYFHSDCTDSILWAQATYDSGKVFSPDYNYAALLPFGASVWLIPLIHFFGVTMLTHVIGMVIFALLLALAIFALTRKLGFSLSWSFGTIAVTFLILSASDKLREIMWNHVIYYSLGILFYVSYLALVLTLLPRLRYEKLKDLKTVKISTLLLFALLLIYTVLIATDGFQMLVLSVLPVLVALFAERLCDGNCKLLSKTNVSPLILVVGIAASTYSGLKLLDLLLGGITSNYAGAYSKFSAPADWPANLDKLVMHWLTLIGMDAQNSDSLFEGESIVNILRIGVAILLFVAPLVLLCAYRKIENRGIRLLAIGHAFLLAFMIFGCVCGRLAAANWRLTPLLASSVITTVAAVYEAGKHRKPLPNVAYRIGVCTLAALALFSFLNFREIQKMPFDYGRDNTLHKLTSRLEEEGLSYGYATFWQSQAITLLSDSKVKTREILVDRNGITTDRYQSQGAWYLDQPGQEEYFVLLSQKEYETVRNSDWWLALNQDCYVRSFAESRYMIFVFSENIWEEREYIEPVEPDSSEEDPSEDNNDDAP